MGLTEFSRKTPWNNSKFKIFSLAFTDFDARTSLSHVSALKHGPHGILYPFAGKLRKAFHPPTSRRAPSFSFFRENTYCSFRPRNITNTSPSLEIPSRRRDCIAERSSGFSFGRHNHHLKSKILDYTTASAEPIERTSLSAFLFPAGPIDWTLRRTPAAVTLRLCVP